MRNIKKTLLRVSMLIGLSFAVGAAGSASAEEPQEFYIGEQNAGYEGVFCRTEQAADFVFGSETGSEMVIRFNMSGQCIKYGAAVEVLGLQKTYTIDGDTWNLIQVKTPDSMIHFIVTKLPVYNGQST